MGGSGAWTTIMQEGFEASWPSAGWQVSDPGFGEYYWSTRNCRAATGNSTAWAIGGGSLGEGLGCGARSPDKAKTGMGYGALCFGDATPPGMQATPWLYTKPTRRL